MECLLDAEPITGYWGMAQCPGKIPSQTQLTAAVLPRAKKEESKKSWMPVEASSRTIVQSRDVYGS